MGKITLNTTTRGSSTEKKAHGNDSRSKERMNTGYADWLLQTLIFFGIFKIRTLKYFAKVVRKERGPGGIKVFQSPCTIQGMSEINLGYNIWQHFPIEITRVEMDHLFIKKFKIN